MKLDFRNYVTNDTVHQAVKDYTKGGTLGDFEVRKIVQDINKGPVKTGVLGTLGNVFKTVGRTLEHITKYTFNISDYRNKYHVAINFINSTSDKLASVAGPRFSQNQPARLSEEIRNFDRGRLKPPEVIEKKPKEGTDAVLEEVSNFDRGKLRHVEVKEPKFHMEEQLTDAEVDLKGIEDQITDVNAQIKEIKDLQVKEEKHERLLRFTNGLPALFERRDKLQKEVTDLKNQYESKPSMQLSTQMQKTSRNLLAAETNLENKFKAIGDIVSLKGLSETGFELKVCQDLLKGKLEAYTLTPLEESKINNMDRLGELEGSLVRLGTEQAKLKEAIADQNPIGKDKEEIE